MIITLSICLDKRTPLLLPPEPTLRASKTHQVSPLAPFVRRYAGSRCNQATYITSICLFLREVAEPIRFQTGEVASLLRRKPWLTPNQSGPTVHRSCCDCFFPFLLLQSWHISLYLDYFWKIMLAVSEDFLNFWHGFSFL